LADVPDTDRARSVELDSQNDATKTLGVMWIPHGDTITFKAKDNIADAKLTKRQLLSTVAQIFDPLGLLAPVIIRSKLLIQEAWLKGLTWDEELPQDLASKWLNWLQDIQMIDRIITDRCLQNIHTDSKVVNRAIHTYLLMRQIQHTRLLYITDVNMTTEQ